MDDQNICRFIPYHKDYHSIHTINFVLETKVQTYVSLKSESLYKMYYVYEGSGLFHMSGQIRPVSAGDIFFSFPSVPFAIESVKEFKYMYVSFLGARANMILDTLKINSRNCLFHNFNYIEEFWKRGFDIPSELSDLISESVLLYTFSCLGKELYNPPVKDNRKNNTVSVIKKYIDDNFTDTDFSLSAISKEFSYNKKYISSVFKKNIGVGIVEYLNTIRIQHACTMVKQGFTSVNDISLQCGYSDPQYFSKVFKSKMGMSPGKYIKNASQFCI